MEAIWALRLIVDFARRYFQVGHVERKAMVRNNKNRWIFPLVSTARGRAELEAFLRKCGIAKLEFYLYMRRSGVISKYGRFQNRNGEASGAN